MQKGLVRLDIMLTNTSLHTPSSNGIAAGINRTSLEKARTMMNQVSTSYVFWAEVIKHGVDVYNRTAMPE